MKANEQETVKCHHGSSSDPTALEGTRRNPQLAIQLLERRFREWARHSSQEARVTGEITTTVAPELVAALQSMPETVGRREVDLLVN